MNSHTCMMTAMQSAFDNVLTSFNNYSPAEVFREIVDTGTAVCDPPCANGDCINPGLCLCDRGWTGLDCLTGTDIYNIVYCKLQVPAL